MDSPLLAKKDAIGLVKQRNLGDRPYAMVRELRTTRLDLYKDPASNLKRLLYGLKPSGEVEVEVYDGKLDLGSISTLHKTLDVADATHTQSQEVLIGRQDAYIEQLEKDNNLLKTGLDSLSIEIREVITENHRLIQEHRSHLLNFMLRDATTPVGPKGLSDEEKMSHGLTVGSAGPHLEKIQQLEDELDRSRLEVRAKNNKIVELKSALVVNEQTSLVIQLKTDNEELIAIVRQLEDMVNKMKLREKDSQQQIKLNTALIEQTQFEKVQALMERAKAKEDLQNQQQKMEELVKEYEMQAESDQERMLRLHKNKLEEMEQELANAISHLSKIQSNLEKAEREKFSLQHQLQKAQNRLEHFHGDMQQMVEKLQEEITKALLQRNIALRNLTQVKLNWESDKQGHQQEMHWMKTELAETHKRLDFVELARMKAKSECTRLAEKNRSLEKEMEFVKSVSNQDRQGSETKMGEIYSRMKYKEEELFETMKLMENRYAEQHTELEQMIELQVTLVNRFKNECRDLSNRMEGMLRSHQVTTYDMKQTNEILHKRLLSSSEKCKNLQNLCAEHNRHQVEMKQKLQQMEREVYGRNQKIANLLSQQNILLRERHFMHGEMAFLYERFNSEVK